MQKHTFETIGTTFEITVWDEKTQADFLELCVSCESITAAFDITYSRFRPDSLVTHLYTQTGVVSVPADLVAMLRLYERFAFATDEKMTPTIGVALEDAGYDAIYSLTERTQKRHVPRFTEAVTILDDTHIHLHEPVLFDFGALGKGYLIDMLCIFLQENGIRRFLVNGSGDIRYVGNGVPITSGLEHPFDSTQAVGIVTLTEGALCASATNRRAWGNNRNHYIDPITGASIEAISATWVYAKTAAEADGLSSALFFTTPKHLDSFSFEYLVLNNALRAQGSDYFTRGLFA